MVTAAMPRKTANRQSDIIPNKKAQKRNKRAAASMKDTSLPKSAKRTIKYKNIITNNCEKGKKIVPYFKGKEAYVSGGRKYCVLFLSVPY